MPREAFTCALSNWLLADQRGRESRTTSVLACVLLSSPTLAARVLSRLGVVEKGDVFVDLEVPTGSGRDRIDLELRVVDKNGRLLQRAWIEVKIGARLTSDSAASKTSPQRRAQLHRYRSALDDRDAARNVTRRSPLAFLVPFVDEKRERQQIEETGTIVLLWQTVAELAAHRAHEIAGDQWPYLARRPEASLELANLETFVWILENGKTEKKGKLLMGLSVTDPLDSDLLNAYANAGRALDAVDALVERLEDALDERKWDVIDDSPASETEQDPMDKMSKDFIALPPGGKRWWSNEEASFLIVVQPVDERNDPPAPTPTLVLSLDFEDSERPPELQPKWLEQLQASGFEPREDADNGKVAAIETSIPLSELLSTGEIATDHATAAAVWIEAQLKALEKTPPTKRQGRGSPR